ncbi:Protein of unknown function DUF516 [Ferroglobus placidus DSM 10642]|uniref:D-aminoacyl-tRNA deacylase n=1 Tax=Ferroglobus placidus (strain DSM 10642 / AEDII12DO) TaxID=589924 RepID=D3S202_FERPA|nr:D-aminoacyl-tRNA deacylase [Ferroglobus placidus]ADC64459.1 Protein of unknown function DUF516 [Ferroglobus placidus DSM 10642]
MKLVVFSKKDPASQNIKNFIFTEFSAEEKKVEDFTIYDFGEFLGVEIEERLIYADFLDEKLSKFLSFEEMIFASRHSSKDGRKILTAHFTGNLERADYGGKAYSLAKPSPDTLKNYVLNLELPEGFEFSLEATHHGPSEIKKKSLFVEIGSTEEEWKNEEAGEAVGRAIIEAVKSESKWKKAISVGGTHYAPRQTEIVLETTVTFGHIFAKYTFESLTPEFLVKAFELSEAEFIVIDEKSVNAKVKEKIFSAAQRIEAEVLKSKEVKRNFRLSK